VGSDYLRGRVPRPVLLAAAVTAMGAAHLSLTQARTPAPLYACCCVAGTAYGCVWSLLPAIVGDLFPPSRFATFYNLFSLSASSSSLLLSTLLATKVYAAHAHTAGAAVVAECSGPECYRDTHMGVVAVCVGGAACALAVAGRNRHIYGRLGAAG
jgi:MFS family permease